MTPERVRLLRALAVSAVLLAALAWAVDIDAFDPRRIDPRLAALAVAAYVGCILLRAALLRSLAPPTTGAATTGAAGSAWMRLAARHQVLFMLAPSGSGDLGFPLLARRHAGIAAADAVRMLVQVRLRDIAMLAMLLAVAIAWIGASSAHAVALAVAGLAALHWIDRLVAAVFALASRIAPAARIAAGLGRAGRSDRPPPGLRLRRTLLAAAAWTAATGALMLGFAACGRPVSPAEAALIVCAVNLAGALALSVAGLGVSEAGVAGVLALLGDPPAQAAAVALLARPLLLLSMISASALVDLSVQAAGAARRRRSAT